MKKVLAALIFLSLCFEVRAGEGAMKITSSMFENNAFIPKEYSCQGKGVNPPLSIEGLPKAAKSLVLIVDDPDAPSGNFIHWVLYDIAVTTSRIDENSVVGKQGLNSMGKKGYASPCPPSGTHRYFFKAYALDAVLNLKEGLSKEEVERAMEGHTLDKAELIGLYQKK